MYVGGACAVLCGSLAVLAPAASANSTLSYPASPGPLTVTANDSSVTITAFQIIEPCPPDCDSRLTMQSPQKFTSLHARCTASFPDGSQFNCQPLPTRVDVTASPGADTLSASGAGGTGCASPIVRFVGLGGPDELRGGCAADELVGGDGRDTLTGGDGNDDLDGGADADELHGEAGADALRGGDGRDTLLPGLGADSVVSGGAGVDTVSYEDRVAGVTVSIGAAADDGEPGEGDNVAEDVENVVAGSGNDTLTGDGDSNDIDGGLGADSINPGGGSDIVDGGLGDDSISALDGAQDSILCGAGIDTVTADAFDVLDGCEAVTVSRELMRDVDNDGLAASDGDCQDRDPTIRLGLPDLPGDGIDSDCVGGDAGDVDRDGLTAAAGDCQDRDATIRPGLPDRPGDGVDSDCAGGDAPYPRVLSGWSHAFRYGAKNAFIRYTKLDIIDVPDQATVELTCRGGRGCFKGTRRSKHPRGVATLKLARHLARFKLRSRSVVEIRILRPETVGKVIRLTTQRGKRDPVVSIQCLRPGATKPTACS